MSHSNSGISYFLAGFSLLTKPGIKRFVIIPLLINFILFMGLFFLLRHFMSEFNQWFEGLLPNWLHWLSAILWFLFFISFFLVFIYTFVTIANLISAPFNSLLAEKVELYLTNKVPASLGLYENVKDVPRILGRQFGILGYYLPRALLILVLFFIPVIQAIAPLIWFLFNAWNMALTYIDYPTDNHRVPLKDVRAWLKEKKFISYGFGISVLVATMIPVLNFFTIPAAVAGATKFWIEENKRSK